MKAYLKESLEDVDGLEDVVIEKVCDLFVNLNKHEDCWCYIEHAKCGVFCFENNDVIYLFTISVENILFDVFLDVEKNTILFLEKEGFISEFYDMSNLEYFATGDVLNISEEIFIGKIKEYIDENKLYFLIKGDDLRYETIFNILIERAQFVANADYVDYQDVEDSFEIALSVIAKEKNFSKIEAYNYLLKMLAYWDYKSECIDYLNGISFVIEDEVFYICFEFYINGADYHNHYLEVDVLTELRKE